MDGNDYRILEWDTAFFGYPVALISSERSSSVAAVGDIAGRLRAEGVRLAYWPSPVRIPDDEIARLGGFLADEKTTFVADIERSLPADFLPDPAIVPYVPSMGTADMISLAIQSGEFSRFALDPRIPRHKFEELYTHWIEQSLGKENADEVLVIPYERRLIGMVTLANRNGRGVMGLMAVSKEFRGKGYGEALVRASQCWCRRQGYEEVELITQGANRTACTLYLKSGYHIENVVYYYHLWLS